jgi:multidrug resistance protein, MATE family
MLAPAAPPVPRSQAGRASRRRRSLLFRHEVGALSRIAAPIILAQLGAVGMNTMDTIMVGPLGAEALAAVGLASALHIASLIVCTGTVLGMGPLVSQAFGAGELRTATRVLVQGMWLALLLSLPVIWFAVEGERIALLLGQQPEVAALVGDYMWALAFGVVPVLLFLAARQYLEGMSLTKPAMVVSLWGLAVNYVGNRVLIFGVEGWVDPMGVVGSGWSTTVVRWAMLFAMLLYLLRAPGVSPLAKLSLRPRWPMVARIAGIGLPAGLQLGLEVGLFSFAAVMMGWFGAVELGAHQVTMNIASTTFMLALGMSLAGSVRVGQRIGAGDVRGARRAAAATYLLALAFMVVCAGLFLLAPERLIGLYTKDPELRALGVQLLFYAALFQLFDGAQVAGFCILRGAADTRIPMFLAGLAYWVIGVPLAWYIAFRRLESPVGIWMGLVIALLIAAVLLAWRVRTVVWQRSPVRVTG